MTASTADTDMRMLADHPGWLTPTPGRIERAFRWDDRTWVVSCGIVGVRFAPTAELVHPPEAVGAAAASRLVDVFEPAELPEPFRSVAPIRDFGRVQRLRNPDLWDALLTPVLQHRKRRSDAVGMYRRLCSAFGEKIRTARSSVILPPRPDKVVALDDAAFAQAKLLHPADRLRAIATAYLTHADIWHQLEPDHLFLALQQVRDVGPWTAAAATADLTNDFSFYPPLDFAQPTRWEQFSKDYAYALRPLHFRTAWERMGRRQKSVLAVLSIDWRSRHPLRHDETPLVTQPPEQLSAQPSEPSQRISPWETFFSDTDRTHPASSPPAGPSTELSSCVEFAAADAAYNTWREQINIPNEPLTNQEPEVQNRWLKIAAAARTPVIENTGAAR